MMKDEEAVPVEDPEPGLSLFPVGREKPEFLGVPHLFGYPRLTRDVKPPSYEVAREDGKRGIPQASIVRAGRRPE